MKKIYTIFFASCLAVAAIAQNLEIAGSTNAVGGVSCFYYDAIDNLTYVVGSLSSADGNPMKGAAAWNGSSWTAIGDPSALGSITAMNDIVRCNDTLWTIGIGVTIDGSYPGRILAYWDGAAWVSSGYGIFGNSHYLAVLNNRLWVAGNISGGMPVDSTISAYESLGKMAYWNGHKLVADANYNSMFDSPNDIIEYNGKLYANERVYDGNTWSDWSIDLVNGSAEIKKMFVHKGKLYVSIEHSTNNYILQYDGSTIDTVANNIDHNVTDMASMGDNLVACGNFNSFDGGTFEEVAVWDGNTWTGIDDLLGGNVNTLGNYNGQLLLSTIEGHPIYSDATQSNVGSVATFGDPLPTSVVSVSRREGMVYPNPSNGTFTLTGISEKTEVRVFNVLGEEVSRKIISGQDMIQLGDVPAGMYTLRLQSQDGLRIENIVVQ
ncbi:MAG: T9SS type A sorting domain-containing protein [Flavobacteriales bacterium]|nr:T9SS type A sorting domain-containing protein [Flavobacteriales bacterium]